MLGVALSLLGPLVAGTPAAHPRPVPASQGPAPSLFLSPSGSDGGRCTASAPCRSFDRAYHLAQPGQVVELAAGDYGGQSLSYDPTKVNAGKYVVFRPAPGASATVSDELSIRTAASQPVSWVEFDHIAFGDYYVAYARHLIFRGDTTAYFFLRSVSDVRILGGQVGPNGGSAIPATIGNYSGTAPSANVTIDGVTFTGLTRSRQGQHIECLFVQESDHLTVRDSRFSNCDVMSIYLSAITGGQISNALIENNFIAAPTDHSQAAPYGCRGCIALAISAWETPNLVVRYNSLSGSTRFAPGPGGSVAPGIQAIANVGYQNYCSPGVGYAYNVWSGVTCGSTDKRAPADFVDSSSLDFHLLRGAPALGRGDPSNAPSTDIDGQPRPRRMAPDAGADQREPASIVFGKSIGAVRIGMQEEDVLAFFGGPRQLQRRRKLGPAVRQASYRAHGGRLWLVYDGRTVVGVGTTSPYYESAKGIGAGVDVTPGIRRLPWDPCMRGFRRSSGGVDTYFRVAGGREGGAKIGSILIERRAYRQTTGCR
jgi:hypothetical protein